MKLGKVTDTFIARETALNRRERSKFNKLKLAIQHKVNYLVLLKLVTKKITMDSRPYRGKNTPGERVRRPERQG